MSIEDGIEGDRQLAPRRFKIRSYNSIKKARS